MNLEKAAFELIEQIHRIEEKLDRTDSQGVCNFKLKKELEDKRKRLELLRSLMQNKPQSC